MKQFPNGLLVGPILYYHTMGEVTNYEPTTTRMRESRKFCQKGSTFDNLFLVDEGTEDPKYGVLLACR